MNIWEENITFLLFEYAFVINFTYQDNEIATFWYTFLWVYHATDESL